MLPMARIPALLTRTSSWPNRAMVCSTVLFTVSSSVRSPGTSKGCTCSAIHDRSGQEKEVSGIPKFCQLSYTDDNESYELSLKQGCSISPTHMTRFRFVQKIQKNIKRLHAQSSSTKVSMYYLWKRRFNPLSFWHKGQEIHFLGWDPLSCCAKASNVKTLCECVHSVFSLHLCWIHSFELKLIQFSISLRYRLSS